MKDNTTNTENPDSSQVGNGLTAAQYKEAIYEYRENMATVAHEIIAILTSGKHGNFTRAEIYAILEVVKSAVN